MSKQATATLEIDGADVLLHITNPPAGVRDTYYTDSLTDAKSYAAKHKIVLTGGWERGSTNEWAER